MSKKTVLVYTFFLKHTVLKAFRHKEMRKILPDYILHQSMIQISECFISDWGGFKISNKESCVPPKSGRRRMSYPFSNLSTVILAKDIPVIPGDVLQERELRALFVEILLKQNIHHIANLFIHVIWWNPLWFYCTAFCVYSRFCFSWMLPIWRGLSLSI